MHKPNPRGNKASSGIFIQRTIGKNCFACYSTNICSNWDSYPGTISGGESATEQCNGVHGRGTLSSNAYNHCEVTVRPL